MLGAILLVIFACGVIPNLAEYPPPEVKEYMQNLHNICVKKLSLPDDITKNYDFSYKSPEIMCYMKCIMIEGGWQGEDEVARFDILLEKSHPEVKPMLELIQKKCSNLPTEGITQECEKTYNFIFCAYKADPEHFYLP